ncbi:hypothetical protein HUG12_10950 [Halorarum salinum]|uniref:Adenine methyltransferase n=2 Tax=Halorarum salinum TaxID=2743089 RepID=A0A7D5QJ36_9EURY|nr:hypothetical protein HUG12_10950 [Halobaculum salinum]
MANESEDVDVGDSTATDGGSVLQGHRQETEDNEYATPPEIWRPLARATGGFDVDPASGAEPVSIAPIRYTEAEDGLSKAWEGSVFLNPPWSSNGDGSAKETWLRKARNEANRAKVDVVVVVLPADTSAHWFHDHVLAAEAVCLVGPGRIPFVGEDRNPSFQLAVAAFGDVDRDLVDALETLGAVIRGHTVVDDTTQASLGAIDEASTVSGGDRR